MTQSLRRVDQPTATIRTALHLQTTEVGTIGRLADHPYASELLKMGIAPGQPIRLMRKAPFGAPLYLKVGRNLLAIGLEEAQCIILN